LLLTDGWQPTCTRMCGEGAKHLQWRPNHNPTAAAAATAAAATGIKAIKLYAWEKPYHKRIHGAREEELHMVYTTQLLLLVRRGGRQGTDPVCVCVVCVCGGGGGSGKGLPQATLWHSSGA
jgi:hypothetical protein